MKKVIAIALVWAMGGCSKDSQHELGKAADKVDQAAHEAAHAVVTSASDDAHALEVKLREVNGKIEDNVTAVAHATDDTARKTASDALVALQNEASELKAKIAAAKAAHAGSDGSAAVGSGAGSGG